MIAKKVIELKKKYEANHPGKPFMNYVKEVCEEVIANFDHTKMVEFANDMEKVKQQFIQLDPDSKISEYLTCRHFFS